MHSKVLWLRSPGMVPIPCALMSYFLMKVQNVVFKETPRDATVNRDLVTWILLFNRYLLSAYSVCRFLLKGIYKDKRWSCPGIGKTITATWYKCCNLAVLSKYRRWCLVNQRRFHRGGESGSRHWRASRSLSFRQERRWFQAASEKDSNSCFYLLSTILITLHLVPCLCLIVLRRELCYILFGKKGYWNSQRWSKLQRVTELVNGRAGIHFMCV